MQTALIPYKKNEKWRKEITKVDSLHVFKLASRRPQKIRNTSKNTLRTIRMIVFLHPCINIDELMKSSIF